MSSDLDDEQQNYKDTADTEDEENYTYNPLRCHDCELTFTSRDYLYKHILHHVRQPVIRIERLQLPPLKITLKTRGPNSFEIVRSPTDANLEDGGEEGGQPIVTSPGAGDGLKAEEPWIPGAEPTPPPESSPDYPKIRIKTTGLLKEPLTITEITDENPDGEPGLAAAANGGGKWAEDSLKASSDSEDILSLFNNNEKAKDYGFCTSDSEYMPMEGLDRGASQAMQVYHSPEAAGVSSPSSKTLESLTGLPMQALAQQVSRLQPPSSASAMHQQNVLINIQQFPSAPQPQYQPPPPMYHPQPAMYPPYQYQPPAPMYYPGGYPPQHMPPPPMPHPAMGHPGVQQQPPPPPQYRPQVMSPAVRQQMAARMAAPPQQPARGNAPARSAVGPGQRLRGVSGPRPRAAVPMRGAGPSPMRGVRPRMATAQTNGGGAVRRPSDGFQRPAPPPAQAKRRRVDVLTPEKDDDDCQVIMAQPRNTDGGLPQIESVRGGTSEVTATDPSKIMHLPDSITLSVRNPPPKPVEPVKKAEASAVANILATRGITVTATPKPKDGGKQHQQQQQQAMNLNGAVSIVPTGKQQQQQQQSNGQIKPPPEMVDLTDEPSPQVQQQQPGQRGLPFQCDLCPAAYPNAAGLGKHRQSYHKTNNAVAEMGIPVVNVRLPGTMQRLAALGFHAYIPLASAGANGCFAVPVVTAKTPAAGLAALGAADILNLGPLRPIARPPQRQTKGPGGGGV